MGGNASPCLKQLVIGSPCNKILPTMILISECKIFSLIKLIYYWGNLIYSRKILYEYNRKPYKSDE